MTVLVDGPTLSRLLYSYLNNQGNQYGLLLGEKINQVQNRVSDSQIHTSDVNSLFCISSFLPWPSNEPMFSRSGCLNEEYLQQLLATTEQSVVGWYSFRHQSVLRPSLREVTYHNNLASCRKFDGRAEDFCFFLCTSSYSSNMSTFTCNHVFMQLIQGCFKKIPVTILNLGDTTRKEYRKQSNATLSHCGSVNETLQKARKRFVQPSGEMDQVVRVSHLALSLSKSLETLQSKLTQSEGILGLLEADVDTLRSRLRQLEQEEIRELLASDAERRRREEQQERMEEDQAAEAEEQAQMEKLLKDLGLSSEQGDGASGMEASGASTHVVPVEASLSLGAETFSDKNHVTSAGANDSKMAIQDSEESNESGSDELLSNVSVKRLNGQKTYSRKKESDKPVKSADPFDFLATENEKQKVKLMKSNKPTTTNMPKANTNVDKPNTMRFAGLSNSTESNGFVDSSKCSDMLGNGAHDVNSTDEEASTSSNEVQVADSPSSVDQDHVNEINGSCLQTDTYVISSSPSF
ncbi:BRCA1-A complex subunit Abraxas [Elysia marginata]|uniref:BRCA1-A complex subunit Abraxas n=1 Tax=Elysia marginata TaxID=1093978 RepID=A0AAV4EV79_9GAST|nr:BRCA1-A complex subunit Abraxas [Elysia marginata]